MLTLVSKPMRSVSHPICDAASPTAARCKLRSGSCWVRSKHSWPHAIRVADELTSVVDDCLALLATVHTRLTETGASVDLFHRTERTRAQLACICTLDLWMSGEDSLTIGAT